MALGREIGGAAVGSLISSRKKKPDDTSGRDYSPAPWSKEGQAQAQEQKKRSFGQSFGRALAEAGKKRATEGGKRPPPLDTSQYSVSSMGLAGPISGSSPDFLSNGRRKRSNGKRE